MKLEGKFTRAADSRWSWVVCVASFLLQFLVGGISNSFGTFFIALLNEFKRSEAETAWIGSLAVGLTYLLGPLSTNLCRKFGCRIVACTGSLLLMIAAFLTSLVNNMMIMYLSFGVLGGIALSFLYFSSLVILIEYFNKHLSLANGITVSGSGTGTLVISLIAENVCTRYGLRAGYRTLAGLCVIGFIAGLAYSPLKRIEEPKSVEKMRNGGIRNTIKSFLKPGPQWNNKAFIVWSCSLALVLFAYYIPYMYLVRVAELNGVHSSKGALLVGFLAISQTVGKIVFGKLADVPRINRLLLNQIALLVVSVATCLFPLAKSYGALVSYAVVQGFFDGGFVAMVGLVTHDIVGKDLRAVAVGSMSAVIAIPMTAGPPVAGFIYDFLGSYNAVYFLASGMVCTGLCLMFLIPLFSQPHPCEEKRVLVADSDDYPVFDEKDPEFSALDQEKLLNLFGKKSAADLLLERNRSLLDNSLSDSGTRPSSFVLFSIVSEENYRDVSTYTSRVDLTHDAELNSPRISGTPRSKRRFFSTSESHNSNYSLHSLSRHIPGSSVQIHVMDSTIVETAEPSHEPSTGKVQDNPHVEFENLESENVDSEECGIEIMDSTPEFSCLCAQTSLASAESNDYLKSSSQLSTGTYDSGFDEESGLEFRETPKGFTESTEYEINIDTGESASNNITKSIEKCDDYYNYEHRKCTCDQETRIEEMNLEKYSNETSTLKSCILHTDRTQDKTNLTSFINNSTVRSLSTVASDYIETPDYYSVLLDNHLECLAGSVYSLNTEDGAIPDIARLGPQMHNFTETVV